MNWRNTIWFIRNNIGFNGIVITIVAVVEVLRMKADWRHEPFFISNSEAFRKMVECSDNSLSIDCFQHYKYELKREFTHMRSTPKYLLESCLRNVEERSNDVRFLLDVQTCFHQTQLLDSSPEDCRPRLTSILILVMACCCTQIAIFIMFICNKKDSTYQIDNLAADFKTMVKSQKEFHDSMKCLSNGIKSDVIALRAMHDTERRKCNDTTNSFLLHHFDRIMQVIDELRVVVYGAVGSTIAVVPPPIEIANNNVSAYPLSCERSEGKLPRSTPYRPGHKIPVHPHIGNFAATERNGLTIQLGQGEASSKQDNNFDITTDAGRAKLKQHFQRSQQELKDNKDLGSQKSQKSRTDEENTEPSDKRTESVPGHQEWKDTKGRSESEVGVVTSLRYNDILTERNKGLKRVLVPGRGWVGSKRLQDEVQQYGRNGFVRKFD